MEEVANSTSCEVIHLFDEMSNSEAPERLLCDGLHFSTLGNKLLADLVSPFVNYDVQCADWRTKAGLE